MAIKPQNTTEQQLELNECLLQFTLHNNINGMKDLLAKGADPHASHPSIRWIPGANTALRYAAYIGCVDRINALLSFGAKVNPDNPKANFLTMAVNNHKEDFVIALLDKGANIESTSASGKNSLQYALRNRNTQMMQLLIHSGAKFDYLLNDPATQKLMMNNQAFRSFIENEALKVEANCDPVEINTSTDFNKRARI